MIYDHLEYIKSKLKLKSNLKFCELYYKYK